MDEATKPETGRAEMPRAAVQGRSRLLARRLDVASQVLTLGPVAGLISLALVWSQPPAVSPLAMPLPPEAEALTRPMVAKRASIEIVPVRTQPTITASVPIQPRAGTPAPTAAPPAVAPPASPAAPQPPVATVPTAATIAGREECKALLASAQIEFEEAPPTDVGLCQAPAPIKVTRIGRDRVQLVPPAIINCRMAVSVADWLDRIVQPAAAEHFNQTVTMLGGVNSLACRNRNNAATGPISEHAFANAFDVSSFRLSGGRQLTVAADWGPVARDGGKLPIMPASIAKPVAAGSSRAPGELDQEPAEFLRRIHAGACPLFSTVLGPEANDAHRDHLHFDLKSRNRKPLCE
jgi:hypothetical protein